MKTGGFENVPGVLIRFRLFGDEANALLDISSRELRKPRDQVRYILRKELERLGVLPTEVTESIPGREVE